MDGLQSLLNDINYHNDELIDATMGTIQKYPSGKVRIVINTKTNLSLKTYLELNEAINKYFNQNINIQVIPKTKDVSKTPEYFKYYETDHEIKFLFKKDEQFNKYFIAVTTDEEKITCTKKVERINKILKLVGLDELEIFTDLSIRTNIQEKIEKDRDFEIEKIAPAPIQEQQGFERFHKKGQFQKNKRLTLKEQLETDIFELEDQLPISKICNLKKILNAVDPDKRIEGVEVLINGELNKYDFDEIYRSGTSKAGKEYRIISPSFSDHTDSITATIFCVDDQLVEEYKKLFKKNKEYLIKGVIKEDQYRQGEISFSINHINVHNFIEKEQVFDNAPEKRIELHTHTKMSQMDSVADDHELIEKAFKMGHKGIAITDHSVGQSFPHIFNAAHDYNKEQKGILKDKIAQLEEELAKEENKDNENLKVELENTKIELENYVPFKVGYGVELNLLDKTLNVCFNPNDKLIKDTTFVVFDTETTGFNAGVGDQMIEIGGVKIKDGNIVDRFDEFINPGRPLDKEISQVTGIVDADLKDADTEENVIKRFKEWIQDSVLVAHNAKFDKSMLDMAYYKYNLGTLDNAILDTLQISRIINRELKKHSLKALGKKYGVDTGEADDEDTETVQDNDIEIEKYFQERIKDILVNDTSVIKIVNDVKYITKAHLAAKTSSATVKVIYDDNQEYTEEIELHAADNKVEIKVNSVITLDIDIYVGQHHGADADSENTALIFNKMLKQIEGIEKISDFNNYELLEDLAYKNDPKLASKVGELCSYKNYLELIDDDKEIDILEGRYPKRDNPLEKYGVDNYQWRFDHCHDNILKMYENIPEKTISENIAYTYGNNYHFTVLARNKKGLKSVFKLISYAGTNFLYRESSIPREIVDEFREDLLIGSACLNGEIFYIAETQTEEKLIEAMKWYDYIEVQPPENYMFLLKRHDISSLDQLYAILNKIINCAKKANKLIVATGDVHQVSKNDLMYREIIVNQNVPGKGQHPLARYFNANDKYNPNATFIDKLELEYIDKKVLKLIYVLTNYKEIIPNLSNIAILYKTEKGVKEEEIFDTEEKEQVILKSINTLMIKGYVERTQSNTFVLASKAVYEKNDLPEMNHIPNQYFRSTEEMLEAFSFIQDEKLRKEVVITNTHKVIDLIEPDIEVVVYPEKPFSPLMEKENPRVTSANMVYEKAHRLYGDPLPEYVEERIAQEFYGDKITDLVRKEYEKEKSTKEFKLYLHETILKGYDHIVDLKANEIKERDNIENDDEAKEKAKLELSGIIGGGFDVIYLIAQRLVKHSNDDGYIVGSRGSVGSSFVASMMGITECNSLIPHYYCEHCHYGIFEDENGKKFDKLSGFDLPKRICEKCGNPMTREGNDMPFATFLGFSGEKVPDIDLNFSGDNQANAHNYTKVLFGTDNVYRAGTIGTVADKTAVGFVLGYYETIKYSILKKEAKSLGIDICTDKELKDNKLLKMDISDKEIERRSVGCIDCSRTTGQHPGGIVVVPEYKDIFDVTPFQYPADDPTAEWRTTHFNYHDIDAQLLKLDILGHDDPTVLRFLKDKVGEDYDKGCKFEEDIIKRYIYQDKDGKSKFDVTKIDLGDEDTMSIFTGPEILDKYDAYGFPREGYSKETSNTQKFNLYGQTDEFGQSLCPTGTLGIPEFGTNFLLGMLANTKPTTFAELIKISGLSHGTDVWLGNAEALCTGEGVPDEQLYKDLGIESDKDGYSKVEFKDVIGCRDDIMVNLMKMNVKPSRAFKIMEFVRKGKPSKDPEGWKKIQDELQEVVDENGVRSVPDWYIWSCKKIKYMFPKAHATAYVTSAFRIAWFKVHMPIYYYAAYFSIRCEQFDVESMVKGKVAVKIKIEELEMKKADKSITNKESDMLDVLYLCYEMLQRGFHFENISINESDNKFFKITEDHTGLIIPFSALDGLGDSVGKQLIKARAKGLTKTKEDLQTYGKLSKTILKKLEDMGVLKDIPDSRIVQQSLF